jgi:hypothetical protein
MAPPGMRCEDFGATLGEAIALVDGARKIVTTVTCLAERQATPPSLEEQMHIEIQKLSQPSDTLLHKAIVLHKDEQRFRSAATALALFDTPLTLMPRRFLFGHDNPNADFFFRPAWFQEPFPQQPTELALVLAVGMRPRLATSSDVRAEEQRVASASTLFTASALPVVQSRAQYTCNAIVQLLGTEAPLGSEAIDASLQYLQMQHLGKTPRDYVAAGGASTLAFDWHDRESGAPTFAATCWAMSTQFYTLMRTSFARWRPFLLLAAEQILIPIYDVRNRHWTLVRVQPQFRQIHYYDSMASDGMEHLTAIARYMVHLQKTQLKDKHADLAQWTLRNMITRPLQTDLYSGGVFLLYFCDEFFQARGDLLDALADALPHSRDVTAAPEQVTEWRSMFARRLEAAGNLEVV